MKKGVYWDWDPRQYSKTVDAMVYELTRKKAVTIYGFCIQLSPVDSGAYRASWTISEGSPKPMFVGRQRRGSSTLSAPAIPNVSTKFYRKLYISNGSSYAHLIEKGYSPKAPAGVLNVAIKLSSYVK